MIKSVQAKQMKKAGNCIPLDIQIEILSRIPARSLVRFRRVCKVWRSITHDPYFIDLHLRQARKVRPPSILLFLPVYKRYRVGIVVLDDAWPSKHILSTPKVEKQYILIQGSCNGLLCIYGGDSIELLNPTTGESLTPPEPTKGTSLMFATPFLGFHPETKEYKIIRFFINHGSTICEAYTVGTGSWRQICTVDFYPKDRGSTVKGAMYWLIIPWAGRQKGAVASLDLKDERITRISPPIFEEIYKGIEYQIGDDLVELEDNICMSVLPHMVESASIHMDIWMLNEQTSKHKWNRKYSVAFPWGTSQPRPLFIHNDRVLVHIDNMCYSHLSDDERGVGREPVCLLSYYHHKRKRLREDEGKDNLYVDYKHLFKPFVHVESLVALPKLEDNFDLIVK